MAKLSKNSFLGDPAPDFDDADETSQHVFSAPVEELVRVATAFEKLVAIAGRTSGDTLPVIRPTRVQEVEDDLELGPRTGE